jgi:hypothetical protein
MADWDQNSPADNDLVSQYPANARAARAAVRTNFGVDHREENDGDVGKHEVIQMVAQGSAPTIASGQVGIWNEGGILKTRAGAGAVTDLGLEAGTRMVFYQASAPTGWTAVGSLNDRVLRVNNSTAGNTSGSWTVSGFTVAGHSLTTAQLPSHSHSGSSGSAGSHNHGGTNGSGTLNTNGGGSHNHGGSTGNRSPSTSSAGGHNHTVNGRSYPGTSGTTNIAFGSSGGTAASSNTTSVGNHSHTVSSHDHSISTQANHTHSINSHSHTINSDGSHSHTITIGSTGSGDTHSHGISHNGAWRPAALDVLLAEKD